MFQRAGKLPKNNLTKEMTYAKNNVDEKSNDHVNQIQMSVLQCVQEHDTYSKR